MSHDATPGTQAGPQPEKSLVIRARTEADLDECAGILADVHRHDGYPMRWPDDPRGWLATPKIFAAWVATLDGKVTGHVGLSAPAVGDAAPGLLNAAPDGSGAVMVSRLFVSPAARGCGAGRALMDRAVGSARERGLRPVLDVRPENASATALYERMGWTLLGSSEAQWGSARVTVLCYAAPAG